MRVKCLVAGKFGFSAFEAWEASVDDVRTLPDLPEVIETVKDFESRGLIEVLEWNSAAFNLQVAAEDGTLSIFTTDNFTDGDLVVVTIDGVAVTFEADDDDTIDADSVGFDIGGSAAVSMANLGVAIVTAFPAGTLVGSGSLGGTIAMLSVGVPDLAGSDFDVDSTTDSVTVTFSVRSSADVDPLRVYVRKRSISSVANDLVFNTGLSSIVAHTVVTTVTSTGVAYAWDGVARVLGGIIHLDNSGTSDLSTSHTITVTAFGY